MISGKLVELLSTFSPAELRKLDLLLNSPFFNQRTDLRLLFAYLKDHLHEGTVPIREEAFKVAYPGEPYDDGKLRHLLSFLYKQCEQVLIEFELEKDKLLRQNLLLRGLQGRQLDKAIRSSLTAQHRMLEKMPLRNADWHFHRLDTLRAEMGRQAQRTEKLQTHFQELSGEIDLYFILHKLQMACAALTHQRMFKVEYQLGMMDEILAYIREDGLDQVPEVALCYHCYLMLSRPDEDQHFRSLKAQISQAEELFEPGETRTFYTHLINFCISRINRGEPGFLREVFEIYQLALEAQVLLEDGMLSPFTYKNIVSASIKLGEYAWTEGFIRDYAAYLREEIREDFQRYNLARLHLANGNYRDVVRILNRLYIQDPFTHLDGRITLIKAYYELTEFKQIEYLLENLKQHLRRKEFLTYHKKNYHEFARLTKRLLNLPPLKQTARAKLKSEVMAAELLTERSWLLEKIGEV